VRWLSQRASPHAVEISPADLAERQKRIGIEVLGQRLFRELPKLDLACDALKAALVALALSK